MLNKDNNTVPRRHSADVPRLPRSNLFNTTETSPKDNIKTDENLKSANDSPVSKIFSSNTLNCMSIENEDEPLIRRHSFNSIYLNRKLCLNELAYKTTNRIQKNSINLTKHLKINFTKTPKSLTSAGNSKTVGYANSESNLSSILSTESLTSSNSNKTLFQQYNKVTLKSILNKSSKKTNEKKDKIETSLNRPMSEKQIDQDFFSTFANSSFINNFIDTVITESIERVKNDTKFVHFI